MTSNLEKEKIEFREGDNRGGAKERSSRSLFVETCPIRPGLGSRRLICLNL